MCGGRVLGARRATMLESGQDSEEMRRREKNKYKTTAGVTIAVVICLCLAYYLALVEESLRPHPKVGGVAWNPMIRKAPFFYHLMFEQTPVHIIFDHKHMRNITERALTYMSSQRSQVPIRLLDLSRLKNASYTLCDEYRRIIPHNKPAFGVFVIGYGDCFKTRVRLIDGMFGYFLMKHPNPAYNNTMQHRQRTSANNCITYRSREDRSENKRKGLERIHDDPRLPCHYKLIKDLMMFIEMYEKRMYKVDSDFLLLSSENWLVLAVEALLVAIVVVIAFCLTRLPTVTGQPGLPSPFHKKLAE